MASKRETALCALDTVLNNITGRKVGKRNQDFPDTVPAGGLFILRDGDAGEPEITLGVKQYTFTHYAEVDALVQRGKTEDRDTLMDELLQDLDSAISADPTLGGAVEYARAEAPADDDELVDLEGGANLKGVVVPVMLIYTTTSPLS